MTFILVVQTLFQVLPVQAIDTDEYVMDLVIDDEQSAFSLDYSIDKIDRFNRYGIAIIMDDTVQEDGSTIRKYGLMNSSGMILLNPIYNEISNFDSRSLYYLVTQFDDTNSENWWNSYKQGLVAQKPLANGDLDIVLPIKYNWIPSIDGKTMFELGYSIPAENGSFNWKNEIYGIDSETGEIEKLAAPAGIDLNEFDYISVDRVHDDFYMIYANRNSTNGWESKSWLIDKNGTPLSSFDKVFDWINIKRTNNGNLYAIVQKYNSTLKTYQSGLYKISILNHQVTIAPLLSEEEYENVWYNESEEYVEVNYQSTNGYWVNGRYSLEDEGWIAGSEFGGNQTYESPLYDNDELMVVQSCSLDTTTQNYSCSNYLYKKGDSTKTSLTPGKTYNGFNSRSTNLVIMSNYISNNSSSTNVLVKKQDGTYFPLFSSDVSGWIWVNSNGWLSIYDGNNKNMYFDLTNVTETTTLANLKLTSAYINKNSDSWTVSNRYQMFRENISTYIDLNSLYDLEENKYVYKDIYNLYINKSVDGQFYGTYYRSVKEDLTQPLDSVGFILDMTSNNASPIEIEDITWIDRFNSNGYAKINMDNYKMGLINLDGKLIINPIRSNNYINNLRFINEFDGVNDLAFASYDNNTADLYLLDGDATDNVSVNQSWTNLVNVQSTNINYPTLVTYRDANSNLAYEFLYQNQMVNQSNVGYEYLIGAQKVTTFSNDLSLVKSSNSKIYTLSKNLSLGNELSIENNNSTEVAVDMVGNIVSFSSGLKFVYRDNNDVITLINLPDTITEKASTLSNFSQISDNVYQYSYITNGSSSQAIMYFDSIQKQLLDLGDYNGLNTNQEFGKTFIEFSTSSGRRVFVNTEGSFWLVDETGSNSYNYDGRFIRVTRRSDNYVTLMNLDKSYIMVENNEPVFYQNIYSDSEKKIIYSFWTEQTYGSVLITDSGVSYLPGIQGNPIENSNLIRLSGRINENRVYYGLIKTDGTVIVPLDQSIPNLQVNTKYGIVLPYKITNLISETKYNTANIGIYDLNGDLIPELKDYIAEGDVDVQGNLNVKRLLPYLRVWDNSSEDIYTRNKYSFSTRTFLTSQDNEYYQSYVDGTYKIVTTLGDLANAPLAGNGGDVFIKKVNGTWDTSTEYTFTTYRAFYTLDDEIIIPPKMFNNVTVQGDYLRVTQQIQGPQYVQYKEGLLNKNGEPVACTEYAKDSNDDYILDNDGNRKIDVTCYGINYDKKLNRFSFYEEKTVDNPYNDSQDQYLNLGMTSYFDVATESIVRNGYTQFDQQSLDRKGYNVIGIYENFLDSNPNNNTLDAVNAQTKIKYGIIKDDGSFMIEPKYSYIQDFNTNGYTRLMVDTENYECSWTDNDGNVIVDVCTDRVEGIYSKNDGMILEPKYNFITTTFPSQNNGNDVPTFDSRGLIQIIQRIGERETGIYYVGLADKNGELFGGAIYEYSYYQNGEFYLKKANEDWMIINDDDITDDQMRGSAWTSYLSSHASSIEHVNFDIQSNNEVWFSKMERVEVINNDGYVPTTNNFFIVKTQKFDADFNKTYDYYGVIREDGSVYLDLEYSMISYNKETETWMLEIYNPVFGTEQKAVMAQDKSFIVPFNNKYDSIGDYVDGFAIGTSGQAPQVEIPQPTSANPFVDLLMSTLFLNVKAAEPESDFVLEIIDENGNVVGDLSEKYDSAVFLGKVSESGEVKALVKKDGQYYIATLKSVPFTGEKITSVEIDQTNVSLKVEETDKLFAEIFPLTSTQPKTITWSSSNSEIVSVDGKGNIKALSVGSAVITLTVNQFTTTSQITVGASTSPVTNPSGGDASVIAIVQAVQQVTKTAVTPTFTQKVNSLINVLDGTKEMTSLELKAVLKEIVSKDEHFVDYLSQDEAAKLDALLIETFKDTLKITTQNEGIPVVFEGLALLADLKSLIDGKVVEMTVDISNTLPQEDESILSSYMKSQLVDQSLTYTLNINISQVVGNQSTSITELSRPVTLTFEVPSDFKNQGELEIIRIHNGEAQVLSVTLNENYTFSFITDRFSSFTLVKKVEKERIDEPIQDIIIPTPSNNYWNYAIVGTGVLGLVLAYLIYRRRRLNA